MNHSITVGGLLLVLACIGGLGAMAFGLLMAFAGGMSDAPSEGESVSRHGCIVFAIGLAVLIGSLWRLL